MSVAEHSQGLAGVIPPAARVEWLTLSRLLEELPPVPCRTADAEAWWPRTRRDYNAPPARMAVAGCDICRARAACLAYALAADERFGLWGGATPEERRAMRWVEQGASCLVGYRVSL
jgi:hypothetical protein